MAWRSGRGRRDGDCSIEIAGVDGAGATNLGRLDRGDRPVRLGIGLAALVAAGWPDDWGPVACRSRRRHAAGAVTRSEVSPGRNVVCRWVRMLSRMFPCGHDHGGLRCRPR